MRRPVITRRRALAALGAILLGLGTWSFVSREAFGTWNPSSLPTRIDYCDRRYIPGSHFTHEQIETIGNGFGQFPIRQVGMTAGGLPIFAKPLPDSVRRQFSGPPLPCDMQVYVKVGADDYIGYGLVGGP